MAGRTLSLAWSLSSLAVAANSAALAPDDAPARAHFGDFVRAQGRTYGEGSQEYGLRFALFQRRLAEVEAHNAKASRRWTAAINSLADRTEDELAALRGYRHGVRSQVSAPGGLGLAAVSEREFDLAKLPPRFTWQAQLGAMSDVVNQGHCGSCWAVSSATVLRAHAELYQTDRTFSAQQIVDCTPNPKECGGQGGCSGATAELAMEYAAMRGVVTEEDMKYTGTSVQCPLGMRADSKDSLSSFLAVRGSGVARVSDSGDAVVVKDGAGAKFGLMGWKRLPQNKATPLLEALYTSGPVVVSVDASSGWSMYASGIMDECRPEAIINHAVVLTGFGKEGSTGYWQIQNSWGNAWGEEGFIRLLRRDVKEEDAYCGWDTSPEDGTACKGGPSKVWVCGSCGILYDSVVPTFHLSDKGWWHRKGNMSIAAAAA